MRVLVGEKKSWGAAVHEDPCVAERSSFCVHVGLDLSETHQPIQFMMRCHLEHADSDLVCPSNAKDPHPRRVAELPFLPGLAWPSPARLV